MAIFIVKKADLPAALKEEILTLCESISETEMFYGCIPRAGCLVAVGVLLSNNGISYQLEFENITFR